MLRAGYDVKLASGVITAGGTLGILIPPSVMIIVYAAVAGQSVVKLYAAAMFPGFFLALLYLVYIVGWAMINPKIAAAVTGRANASPCAGMGAKIPDGVLAQHASWAHSGSALAMEGKLHRGGWPTPRLLDAAEKYGCRAGPILPCRRHARLGVVVRRHSPASRGGSRRTGPAAAGHAGARQRTRNAARGGAAARLLFLVTAYACLRARR